VSIFVGNLPFRAEREDVLQLFAPFGEVTNCSLPLERDTGRKRGFAFIEMADETLESNAIDSLQGTEMMGRPLRINKAEPRGSSPRRNFNGGNSRQNNGGYGNNNGGYSNNGGGYGNNNGGYSNNNGGYGNSNGGYGNNNGGYGNNNGGYVETNNGGYGTDNGDQNSNYINRTSGAKGWEDRSFGNNSENSEYESGRSRRRRGGSNEQDINQEDT